MHTFSDLPPRRRMVFLFYSIFTSLVALMGVVSFIAQKDWLIWALIFLPFLGLFQLINALYNAFRGSRMQLIYFFGSLLFLLFYVGLLSGWMPVFRGLLHLGEEYLLFFPVVMAAIYCCILYMDHPDRYRSRGDRGADTLDGGVF